MHKTIGIIGGMSHESTVTYYEHIHRTYHARFGTIDYPPVIIYSVPFSECVRWTRTSQWDEAAEALADAAQRLHAAGAEVAVIATNTMHIVFDAVQARSPIPLLNLIDVTAEAIKERGLTTIGLLGTATTMEHPFYRERLAKHGLTTLVPEVDERILMERVIYDELTAGDIRAESRKAFLKIIDNLRTRGAEGVILGCTEIPLLVQPEDCDLPLFNTTRLHAEAVLNWALGQD